MSAIATELVRLYLKHRRHLERVGHNPQRVQIGKESRPVVKAEALPPDMHGPLLECFGPDVLYVSDQGLAFCASALKSLERMAGASFIPEACRPPPLPPMAPPAEADDPPDPDPEPLPVAVPVPPSRRRRSSDHPLVKVDQINIALAEMERAAKSAATTKDRQEGQRRELLQDLRDRPTRVLLMAHQRQLQALENLRTHFPNFGGVIDWVRKSLRLRIAVKGSMSFPPMLLSGPPGVGKTEFSKRLAECLGAEFLSLSIAATSASFALRGSHKQWANGSPGQIALAVTRLKERRAQFVLLDEIDKLQEASRNYPVEPVLLEVLEPGQSDRFTDEFLEVEMNITPIVSWIATANDSTRISAPLRSRLELFEVPLPTPEQMPAVIRSVDRALRTAQPGLARVFSPLDTEVIDEIRGVSPRDLRVLLEQSYGSALERPKQSGRHRVNREDVRESMSRRTRTPQKTEKPTDEPEHDWVMMVPVRKSGGGAPPGNTVH